MLLCPAVYCLLCVCVCVSTELNLIKFANLKEIILKENKFHDKQDGSRGFLVFVGSVRLEIRFHCRYSRAAPELRDFTTLM